MTEQRVCEGHRESRIPNIFLSFLIQNSQKFHIFKVCHATALSIFTLSNLLYGLCKKMISFFYTVFITVGQSGLKFSEQLSDELLGMLWCDSIGFSLWS